MIVWLWFFSWTIVWLWMVAVAVNSQVEIADGEVGKEEVGTLRINNQHGFPRGRKLVS